MKTHQSDLNLYLIKLFQMKSTINAIVIYPAVIRKHLVLCGNVGSFSPVIGFLSRYGALALNRGRGL